MISLFGAVDILFRWLQNRNDPKLYEDLSCAGGISAMNQLLGKIPEHSYSRIASDDYLYCKDLRETHELLLSAKPPLTKNKLWTDGPAGK
jgi:hypothetical protein